MGHKNYDFSGWATRNDLKCSDGRTIRRDAFRDDDGHKVPLVWNHQHDEPYNVLGHAVLENRPEGVYTYCTFNNSPAGQQAKELVMHGDITALSIYANKLKQRGGDVLHGAIREVSLVYAPANPGAYIEIANLEHGDFDDLRDSDDAEATIYFGNNLYLSNGMSHSDAEEDEDEEDADDANEETKSGSKNRTVEDVYNSLNEEQKKILHFLIGKAVDEASGKKSNAEEEPSDEKTEEEEQSIKHSDDSEKEKPMANGEKTIKDVFDTFTEEQKKVAYFLIAKAAGEEGDEDEGDEEMAHAEDEEDPEEEGSGGGKTVREVYESLNDEQKQVLHYLMGRAAEEKNGGGAAPAAKAKKPAPAPADDEEEDEDEEVAHGYYGGETFMKQNAFDMYGNGGEDDMATLSHAEVDTIIKDGARYGSMRDSVLAHADEYGIENIEYLFPDARTIESTPDFIQRDTGWVQKVIGGTRHTPFSRIKSIHANITEDEARAKGYIKGHLKKDEVFKLLKRTTDPQTVYKRQKMDRDDIVDITDFDVVAWIKTEMRQMLDEELARAILIGDGRSAYDDDKISDLHIRPVWTDSELYTINVLISLTNADDEDSKAKKFIRAAIKARKNYKGSGEPSLFTTEDMLTDMLLLEDGLGHALYADEATLARKLRVKEIVTVPVMENLTREVDNTTRTLDGLIVNLKDYNVGADKGGAINMFDDFDIDYNQQKYLIETRCSGALVKPLSAIAIEHTVS